MRNLFRAKPKCFLDATRRDWQIDAFAWLLRNCGGYPKFLDTVLVLPVEEHFPERSMKGHAAAAALFRRVRDHAGMADWPCAVEPEPARTVAAAHAPAGRMRVFYYDATQGNPTLLVAGFAHALARYLVESFDEPPPGGATLYEPAVELAAAFMGFGVFMANASVHSLKWQLNEGELVHALAMFCLLRKMDIAPVDAHLNPHLRKYLRLAMRDLAQHEAGFQRLRSVFAVVPLDAAERTLPTPATGGAVR
jgi:hypothetical protein